MNWRSISSVAMKSAITPSRIGRTSSTGSGVLPCMALALRPTASTSRCAAAHLHGHHRGLVDDDAAPDHVHQRIGGAEIDGDIVGECARDAHGCHCIECDGGRGLGARPARVPACQQSLTRTRYLRGIPVSIQ